MRPLSWAMLLFAVVYGGCLVLHAMAAGAAPAGAGVAWYVWHTAGAICLSATTVDIVVLAVWVWLRKCGRAATSGGVPLRLMPSDRAALIRERPRVALLMPAHNEAANEDDRDALADRIFDAVVRTPSYATFFLLADSPASQRENELSVVQSVKRRLRGAGREYDDERVVLEEYRDKPPHWRHKCGSLLMWLRRYRDRYGFMFILDADSSLPAPDPQKPETCDPLERMLVAMDRDPDLALIQASIEMGDYRTPWGWLQAVNTRVGANYYFRVFSYVYGRAAPCYGHNCLFRVSDFARHVRNTLLYTSHDHVDSSDLAAAGRGCVLTDAVVTYEEPEDTLPGWLKRECRWSRGNGQWLVYLLRKRSIPAGVAVYLGLGIMQYVWALLAGALLISSAVLIHQSVPMIPQPDSLPSRLLVGVVLLALLVPKIVATPTLPQFLAGIGSSVVLGPTLTLFQGACFLLGAFGSKWIPRGARSSGFDLVHATRITATFFPAMILGLCLWGLIRDDVLSNPVGGRLLITVMVAGMILSPLTGLLMSRPIPRGKEILARDAARSLTGRRPAF